MVVKMNTEVKTPRHEQGENFNKEIESIFFNYQTEIIELKNKRTELKILIEGSNSRLDQVE